MRNRTRWLPAQDPEANPRMRDQVAAEKLETGTWGTSVGTNGLAGRLHLGFPESVCEGAPSQLGPVPCCLKGTTRHLTLLAQQGPWQEVGHHQANGEGQLLPKRFIAYVACSIPSALGQRYLVWWDFSPCHCEERSPGAQAASLQFT